MIVRSCQSWCKLRPCLLICKSSSRHFTHLWVFFKTFTDLCSTHVRNVHEFIIRDSSWDWCLFQTSVPNLASQSKLINLLVSQVIVVAYRDAVVSLCHLPTDNESILNILLEKSYSTESQEPSVTCFASEGFRDHDFNLLILRPRIAEILLVSQVINCNANRVSCYENSIDCISITEWLLLTLPQLAFFLQ